MGLAYVCSYGHRHPFSLHLPCWSPLGTEIKSGKHELLLDPERLRLSRTETLGQINLWKCNKNKSADTINQKLSVGQMAS